MFWWVKSPDLWELNPDLWDNEIPQILHPSSFCCSIWPLDGWSAAPESPSSDQIIIFPSIFLPKSITIFPWSPKKWWFSSGPSNPFKKWIIFMDLFWNGPIIMVPSPHSLSKAQIWIPLHDLQELGPRQHPISVHVQAPSAHGAVRRRGCGTQRLNGKICGQFNEKYIPVKKMLNNSEQLL